MRPILFHIFGEPIFSYPLMMGFGWGVGLNYSMMVWERDGLNKTDLWKIFLGTFLFGWLGAKLFFLIFSAPEMALDYSTEVNFWLGGGFVFYGGFILAATFAFIYTKISTNLDFLSLASLTPGLAIGHALGRVGCLLAGCCYGDHCDLPIAISFRGEDRHPVQLYESLSLVILFFVLRALLKNKSKKEALIAYLGGYALIRFFLEFFRGDAIRGAYMNLSTSQWVSIVLFVFAVVIYLQKPKTR